MCPLPIFIPSCFYRVFNILTDRYANKTVKIHADRNTKCSFLVTLYLDVPNASMILGNLQGFFCLKRRSKLYLDKSSYQKSGIVLLLVFVL